MAEHVSYYDGWPIPPDPNGDYPELFPLLTREAFARAPPFHEACSLFPPLTHEEFFNLCVDIKAKGQEVPIWIHPDGSILDGRDRYMACVLLGIKPKVKTWNGKGSPLEFALSLNLQRRHLSPSQRATLAVEWLPTFKPEARERQRGGRGGKMLPPNLEEAKGEAAQKAASLFHVSRSLVATAKKLKQENPDLFRRVHQGELTLSDAKLEIIESRREGMRRENRKLVRRTRPLPAREKYSTIVIDPPWDYETEGFQNVRVPSVPYACMSLEQIAALPVADHAEEKAHLYLWTTNLFLPKSFALLEAWGFKYATLLTWTKPRAVPSHYFMSRTEHVIFGVRGSLPLARRGVETHLVGDCLKRHSAKPESFYKLVESCSPGPWLEMFARRRRPGWAVWGAEAKAS